MVPKLIGELIVGLCMIILEAVLFIASRNIPARSASYPMTLIVIAFVLTYTFMSRCVVRIRKEGIKKEEQTGEPGAMLQVIVTMGFIILYLIVMPYLGFVIATLVFVAGIMLYLGMRNILVLIFVPIGVTLFGYLVFNNILYIFLPRGVIFG